MVDWACDFICRSLALQEDLSLSLRTYVKKSGKGVHTYNPSTEKSWGSLASQSSWIGGLQVNTFSVWLHSRICISSVVPFSCKWPNFILHNDLKSCHVFSLHFISSPVGRLVLESSHSNPNKSCYIAQVGFRVMILLSRPPEMICVHYQAWQEINFNDTFNKTHTK